MMGHVWRSAATRVTAARQSSREQDRDDQKKMTHQRLASAERACRIDKIRKVSGAGRVAGMRLAAFVVAFRYYLSKKFSRRDQSSPGPVRLPGKALSGSRTVWFGRMGGGLGRLIIDNLVVE
jgi:hypothetical protein